MREENIRHLLENWQTDGTDENYMRCALALAKMGAAAGEVPVGAVLVKDGVILCGDYNGREETGDATYHAELSVIRQGNRILGGWRLTGCTVYVTLEPCPCVPGGSGMPDCPGWYTAPRMPGRGPWDRYSTSTATR